MALDARKYEENEMHSWYEKIGGDETVAALATAFYRIMAEDPDFKELLELHPKDLQNSRDKLYMFLSGFFGGPQLFIEKHGHPRLRMRHFPFKIGLVERDQWVMCMRYAMRDVGIDSVSAEMLDRQFYRVATHMVNQES